jgi:hypothetical protein
MTDPNHEAGPEILRTGETVNPYFDLDPQDALAHRQAAIDEQDRLLREACGGAVAAYVTAYEQSAFPSRRANDSEGGFAARLRKAREEAAFDASVAVVHGIMLRPGSSMYPSDLIELVGILTRDAATSDGAAIGPPTSTNFIMAAVHELESRGVLSTDSMGQISVTAGETS